MLNKNLAKQSNHWYGEQQQERGSPWQPHQAWLQHIFTGAANEAYWDRRPCTTQKLLLYCCQVWMRRGIKVKT